MEEDTSGEEEENRRSLESKTGAKYAEEFEFYFKYSAVRNHGWLLNKGMI